MKSAPCLKCHGRKTFQGFRHVVGGVCFRCGGSGFEAAAHEAPASAELPQPITRAERIAYLATALRGLERCGDYLSDAERSHLAAFAAASPADVRARFDAALARMGYSL